ncbi:hypothetical protein [Agromyces bauzanensis]
MTDETKRGDDRESGPETDDLNTPGDDRPGSPTSSAPMTDSTDGGLDAVDPGVEE